MATVKKVRKYQNSGPAIKASSDNTRVSGRNYKAEDKIRARKDKENKDQADLDKRSVSRQIYNIRDKKPMYRLSADTTGYSKDKEYFPGTIHIGGANDRDKYGNLYKKGDLKTKFSRRDVDEFIKRPIGLNDDFKKGGKVAKAKNGKWIQKAINPKHKGFCTPQSKATCTPKRKALAQTLRKISKKK